MHMLLQLKPEELERNARQLVDGVSELVSPDGMKIYLKSSLRNALLDPQAAIDRIRELKR